MVSGLVNLALTAILMPMADTYVTQRFRVPAFVKDLRFSQMSGILLFLGFAVMGIAPNVPVLGLGLIISALGSSFLLTLRSSMTSFVPATSVGLLYTTTSVAQGIGTLISGPLLAESFKWGMRHGGFWLGLPYLLSSGLCLVTFMALLALRRLQGFLSVQRLTSTGDQEESTGLISPGD